MPSYAAWLEATKPERDAAAAVRDQQRTLQRKAVVMLEELEASEDWTVYRKSVEAMREQYQADLAALQTHILSPEAVGERLLTLKLQAARVDGAIEALTAALGVRETWQKSLDALSNVS